MNKKQSGMSRALVRRETTAGYLFLLPSLFFFLTFVVYPMVMCIFTSFFDSNMGKNTQDVFIGFGNYIELFKDAVWELYKTGIGRSKQGGKTRRVFMKQDETTQDVKP